MAGLIAVTGATGFIGRYLCQRLLDRGWQVRVLVRATAATVICHPQLATVRGDLADSDALGTLVADADAVIHCAGAVRGRTLADFEAANVAGGAHLLRAVRARNPATRLLVLSSLAARHPELSAYAASKRRGEEVIADEGAGLDWTILRPPAVYGPGDRELLPLFRAMQRGFAPIPGALDGRVSLIYVADLVDAMLAWVDTPVASGAVHTLADPSVDGYSWRQICQQAAAVLGRRVSPLPVPAPLLNGLAAVNVPLSRLLGYQPMLTPGKLRELRHPDWVCGNASFMQATGWRPRVAFAEGLARTLGLPPAAALLHSGGG